MKDHEPDFKEMVISNAKDIFIKYGYKKTTMTDIARSCHKSKGLIYHYYNSKEEIFKIIIKEELDQFLALLYKKINNSQDFREQLKAFFAVYLEFFEDKKNIYSLIIKEIFDYIEIIRDLVQLFVDELYQILGKLINKAKNSGELNIENVEQTTAALMSLIKTFGNDPFFSTLKVDIKFDENLDSLVDIILYGLIKR